MIDVILPVLNEAQALPWVLTRMPDGYAPMVVDNGSTDGSGNLAAGLGARVVREPQAGFGAACHAGLQASTSEVVCFMDCDGSLDPHELPEVAAPILGGAAELVMGARTASRGSWPIHARLANGALTWHLRRRYGVRLSDLGPMRAMPRLNLLRLGISDRRFGWPLEMVTRAAEAGWRISETPVTHLPRAGRSKVTGTVGGTVRTVHDMVKVLRC
ncbi:MAG: glycosyltransferase family 2 protein [Actinomycetota bacterium]|nr:glycosyltransferase family 2 protein [Actinomycetota bacterium]